MESIFEGTLETKRRVLRAVTRPVEEMTVGEISAAAGISRQTFYSLFKSKFDIAYWYLSLGAELYLYEIGRTLTLEDGLGAFFSFLYRERTSLPCAFQRNPRKGELRPRLERVESELLWTAASNGCAATDDLRFCIAYTVESADCLVAGWCLRGMEEPPEVMARRLALCTPQALVSALRQNASEPRTRA